MKNSPLTTILLGALAVLVLGAVGLCWLFLHNTGELRTLSFQAQYQANQLNQGQQTVNALVVDSLSYSSNHPAIDPILESAGIKTARGSAAPASGAPNTKSSTK